MLYGNRTRSLAIEHVLWPWSIFSGHRTFPMAVKQLLWPYNICYVRRTCPRAKWCVLSSMVHALRTMVLPVISADPSDPPPQLTAGLFQSNKNNLFVSLNADGHCECWGGRAQLGAWTCTRGVSYWRAWPYIGEFYNFIEQMGVSSWFLVRTCANLYTLSALENEYLIEFLIDHWGACVPGALNQDQVPETIFCFCCFFAMFILLFLFLLFFFCCVFAFWTLLFFCVGVVFLRLLLLLFFCCCCFIHIFVCCCFCLFWFVACCCFVVLLFFFDLLNVIRKCYHMFECTKRV